MLQVRLDLEGAIIPNSALGLKEYYNAHTVRLGLEGIKLPTYCPCIYRVL